MMEMLVRMLSTFVVRITLLKHAHRGSPATTSSKFPLETKPISMP